MKPWPAPATRDFLVKLVCFVVLLLIADQGIARLLDWGRPVDIRQFIEARQAYDAETGYDVVILGSSHAADAFVPAVIEATLGLSAFNFGVYHASPIETYYLALDLLGRGPAPRVVVYGFDPQTFTRDVDAGYYTVDLLADPWLRFRLLSSSFDDNDVASAFASGRRRGFVFAMLKRLAGIPHDTPQRVVAAVDNGYLMNLRTASPASAEFAEPQRVAAPGRSVIEPDQDGFLRAMVRALKAKGVLVVFARTPITSGRLAAFERNDVMRDATRLIGDLSRDLSVPFFDSYDPAYLARYRPADFLNAVHVCYTGAYRFTRDFAAWLAGQHAGLAYRPIDRTPPENCRP